MASIADPTASRAAFIGVMIAFLMPFHTLVAVFQIALKTLVIVD